VSKTFAILERSNEAAEADHEAVRSLDEVQQGRWYRASEIAPIYGYTAAQAEEALVDGEFGKPRKTRAGWRICGRDLLKKEGWRWFDRDSLGEEELLTEAEALAFLREKRTHFREWVVPRLQHVVITGEAQYPTWALRAYSRGEIKVAKPTPDSSSPAAASPTRGDALRMEKLRRQEALRARSGESV
jgi:hypothetical protein